MAKSGSSTLKALQRQDTRDSRIVPADYLRAVPTDGTDGWISYNDLTFEADSTLTQPQ